MPTLLMTYFGAFEGVDDNPTQRVAERARELLAQSAPDLEMVLVELPVTFGGSGDALRAALAQYTPDLAISTGVAVGREKVSLERVAINCDDARIADNDGDQRRDTPIVEGGPAAYFTTLPYRDVFNRAAADHLPVEVSNSAGTYVCNHVFYELMHALENSEVPGGFVHIPALSPEPDAPTSSNLTAHQDAGGVEGKTVPTQPLEAVARVLEITVLETLTHL